jgi:hypothetical protein
VNNDAVEAYRRGTPIRELSKQFGVSRPTIDRWLTAAGVKKRASYTRKFANSAFFDIWTADSAYWLGFLLADGNITPNRNGVRVRIKRSDSQHLELLAKSLHYPANVRFDVSGHGAQIACLEVNCRPLVRRLDCLGWFDFKNKGNISILDRVPENFRRFLVRGLVDGDGGLTIALTKHIKSAACFSFHDLHESVVLWVRDYISFNLGLNRPQTTQPKGNLSYRVEWHGNRQVKRILDFLYSGLGIKLKRKEERVSLIGASNSMIMEVRDAVSP